MVYRLLVINPGSTSTKFAVFHDQEPVFEQTLRHSGQELAPFVRIADQYEFRKNAIVGALKGHNIELAHLHAIVGRGGLTRPLAGGTYEINTLMRADLQAGYNGEHASNLGGLIAFDIASDLSIPAFVVDPVVVDELQPIARLSGTPLIERRSIFHALNQKAIGRKAAENLAKPYGDCNLIVAHLGGGISVGAHATGRVIDVNNALNGEGPFSPERSGGLPCFDLVNLSRSDQYSIDMVLRFITGRGGLMAYLETNDAREVVERIAQGDMHARLVYEAMAYQIAKEIGSAATVLRGKVDAIVLTGGLAYDSILVGWITDRVDFIAPVLIYPGEDELLALAEGGLRVLQGREPVQQYRAHGAEDEEGKI